MNNTAYSTYGGGAYRSILSNCTVSGNWAANEGGGVYKGTNYNCLIKSNSNSYGFRAGAFSSTLYNCVISRNQGGADQCTLYNCTVVSNYVSGTTAAGVQSGKALNCIIYYNLFPGNPTAANWSGGTLSNCCTTPLPNGDNFTFTPLFVDIAAQNFRLQTNSPCINAGNNGYVTNGNDFDGNPRIKGGTVDVGAYEFQSPASTISYAWLQQYGLPNNGSADHTDTDNDGMDNWHEWICGTDPTSALSVLKMLTPSKFPISIKVEWPSVFGRTYYLQRATNLLPQPGFLTIQSNIIGQTGTRSFFDATGPKTGPCFYRVGVQ